MKEHCQPRVDDVENVLTRLDLKFPRTFHGLLKVSGVQWKTGRWWILARVSPTIQQCYIAAREPADAWQVLEEAKEMMGGTPFKIAACDEGTVEFLRRALDVVKEGGEVVSSSRGPWPCTEPEGFPVWVMDEAPFMGDEDPRIRQLKSQEEAEVVDNHWAYKSAVSLKTVMHCIHHLPSAGLFVDGELVSWAVTRADGSIGMVGTKDAYRGQRYAR